MMNYWQWSRPLLLTLALKRAERQAEEADAPIYDEWPEYPLGTVILRPTTDGRYDLCTKKRLGDGLESALVPIFSERFQTAEEAEARWRHMLQEPKVLYRPDES